MTRDSGFKHVVRARMRETGESYQQSLQHFRPDGAAGGAPATTTPPHAVLRMRTELPNCVVNAEVGGRPARMMIKTGGGAFVLSEPFARELGLEITPSDYVEDHVRYARVAPQTLVADGFEIPIDHTMVALGDFGVFDGMIASRALMPYEVVVDFAERAVTIAPSGSVEPSGAEVDVEFQSRGSLPVVTVQHSSGSLRMVLDTGMTNTTLSDSVLERLAPGQSGGAWVSRLVLGDVTLLPLFTVVRPELYADKYIGGALDARVDGFLAADALFGLRVHIDYPQRKLWVSRPGS